MPTNKVLFSDIFKFFIATIILLLGFLRKEEKVGETQENLFFQDYLDKQDINEISQEKIPSEETHESATEIQDKCTQNNILCKKIKIDDNQEIIPYKNQVYTTTYFINENQIIPTKIIETIKEIDIKNTDTGKRGYATRDTIVLNIGTTQDIDEFQNLSIHELGHIFDLGTIKGKSKTKSKVFTEFNRSVFSTDDPSLLFYKISRNSENIRKSAMTKKDFCSGYGMTNPFEDFAECFNLYINHQIFFKFIANKNKNLASKYNFIATLLQSKYIEKDNKSLLLLKSDNNRRPRDTTKL